MNSVLTAQAQTALTNSYLPEEAVAAAKIPGLFSGRTVIPWSFYLWAQPLLSASLSLWLVLS